jgi:hypothetical protein
VNKKARRLTVILGAMVVVAGAFYLLQLQLAFANVGQEFGAYGQYNRVLRVIRSTHEYAIVRHRVRRKLEWGHLFHVEEFSVNLRDQEGRVAEIFFRKDTDEMKQKDEAALRTILREKFQQAMARGPD